MKNFFSKKNFNKIVGIVLNSKYTYIVLILIVAVQFVIICIMYSHLNSLKPFPDTTLEQMRSTIEKISSQQNLENEKINGLQSNIMMLQSQMYRTTQ